MKVFGFNEKDIGRVRDVVRRIEGYYRNAPPGRGRYPVGGGGDGLIPVRFPGGGCAAGSAATPATCTVTIMMPSGNGFTPTGGRTETLYSTFTTAVGASKSGWATYFNGKLYLVQIWDC